MSIQAVAWALEQDFSYTTPKGRQTSAHGAKLVLISLANHADHTSGHCWPSAATIARESSCNIRSVYRLIAALERNGFIDVKRNRGGQDHKQRSNNYWIRFDRPPAPWQFFADDDDDPQDGPQGDTVSCDSEATEDVENSASEPAENATESPGQSDMGVTRHIMPEPSLLEPSAPPPGFDATARTEEQLRLKAADKARKGDRIFVYKDSDPWKYHVENGHSRNLHTWSPTHRREGWWFKAEDCNGLYPKPKQNATGPPDPNDSPLMSEEDKQFKWG